MVVQRIMEFIRLLRASGSLAEYDGVLLNKFHDQFGDLSVDTSLDVAQLDSIQQMFSSRWHEVVDGIDDYTLNSAGNNQHWISFARELALETNKTYLQLLIPTFTNTVDPIVFSKLTDCIDPRKLYCGADGKTLYSMEGLLVRLKEQKYALSTYNVHTDTSKFKLRPLTFQELLRIRSKGEGAGSFWKHLIQKIVPNWHRHGELPKYILVSLLAVVEDYFSETTLGTKKEQYTQTLLSCSKVLQDCSIIDVNCLYGQSIQVGKTNSYLIDILLDGLKCDTTLDEKFLGLARWLSERDASLIGKHDALQVIYSEQGVGNFFKLQKLKVIVDELYIKSSSDIQNAIKKLRRLYADKTTIDAAVVDALGEVYRLRWKEVQGTALDYTRLQEGVNKPWIWLAELIRGAGFISDEYRYLIPTLTHEVDPVTLAPLTDYPLSHFLPSEDGEQLYLLDNSAKKFPDSRTFYNWHNAIPRRFTKYELAGLPFSHSRFSHFIKLAHCTGENDPPLALSTIMAVKNLVNGSLKPAGLYTKDLDDNEMAEVKAAYDVFYSFLDQLDPAERKKLDVQLICFNGHNRYFCEIFTYIEKGECVALNSRYYIQLLYDYDHTIKLKDEIEKSEIDLKKMRVESRKKVYSDYDKITDEEAKRRVLILAVSIMSYDVQFPQIKNWLNLWDCGKKTIDATMSAIVNLLHSMIETGDFKDARYVYATIMESVVKPAILLKSSLTKPSLKSEVKVWLMSVVDDSLFKKPNAWFPPELLLKSLLTNISLCPAIHHFIDSFFDDFVLTYSRSQENVLVATRVNIMFAQLLNSLEPGSRKKLLQSLELSPSSLSKREFYQTYADLLIHRLAVFGASVSSQKTPAFFCPRVIYDGAKYTEIKDILSRAVGVDPGTTERLFKILDAKITTLLKPACDAQGISRMMQYLKKMTGSMLPNSPGADQVLHDMVMVYS